MNRALRNAFLLALLTATVARPSNADEPAAEVERTRTAFVEIVVSGEPDAVRQMRATARELLGRLSVSSVVVGAGEEDALSDFGRLRPALHFKAYVDLRAPDAPGLVVVEGSTRRELARRALPPSPSLEAGVEAIAHVLYRVVESEIEEAQQPAERPPVRSRTPAARPRTGAATPASQAPPRSEVQPKASSDSAPDADVQDGVPHRSFSQGNSWGFDAGVLVRGVSLGSAHYQPGIGAALDVHGVAAPVGFGALLLAAGHLPTEIAVADVAARLQHFSFRVMPSLDVLLGSSVVGFAALGPGVDWFRTWPERAPTDVQRTASSHVDLTLGALLGLRFRLGDRTALVTAAGLDIDLTPKDYVVDDGVNRQTLLELPRLRPSLLVLASISMLGDPRFRSSREAR